MKLFDLVNFLILVICLILLVINYKNRNASRKTIRDQLDQIKVLKRMIAWTANSIAEFERERISQSLHDGTGTLLNVVRLNLERLELYQNDKKRNAIILKESKELLSEACESIRDIFRNEMDPALMDLGYENGMVEFCRQINISGKVEAAITVNSNGIKLPFLLEVNLFRAIQEIVNNVIKHTEANQLNVVINCDAASLETIITHNGKGVSSEEINGFAQSSKGMGLRGINGRIELIKGSITYFAGDSEPARIVVFVPAPVHDDRFTIVVEEVY